MKDNKKVLTLKVTSNLDESMKDITTLNSRLETTRKLMIDINKNFANLSKTELKSLTKALDSSEKAAKSLINTLKTGNEELNKLNQFEHKKSSSTGSISEMLDGVSVKGTAVASFAAFALNEANKLMEYEKEIKKFASSLNITNKEVISNAAINVKSLSEVYSDLDTNALIKTATTLSKNTAISLDESFALLEKGISTTASDRNEYLDWIEEYTSVLKDSDYTATDILNIQQVAENLGIFKDKLLDTLKEFKLRITDLTKGQEGTLIDAFGEDFTKKLVKDINSGAISAKEGLSKIVKALETTSISAQQQQAIISDIFGAAGEDLGAQFIPAMKEVTQNVGQLDKAFNELSSGQKANLKATKEMNENWNWFKENILPSTNTIEHLIAAFKRLTPIIVGVGLAIATLASGGAVLAIASITAGVLGLAKAWESAAENTYEAVAARKAYGATQSTTSFNNTIQSRGDELKTVKDAIVTLRSTSNKNIDLEKVESILTKYTTKFGTSLETILQSMGGSSLEDVIKGGEVAINQLSNSLLSLDEKVLNSSNVMSILPKEMQQFVNITMSSTDAISNLEAEINKNNKIISGVYTIQGNDLGIADKEKIEKLTQSNNKLRESIDRIKKTESVISDTKLYQGKVIEKNKSSEEKDKGTTAKEKKYTSDIPGLEARVRDLQDKLSDLATSVGASSVEYKRVVSDLEAASKILVNAYESNNKKAKSNETIEQSNEKTRLKNELELIKEQQRIIGLQRTIAEDSVYNTKGEFTRVNVPKGMEKEYKPYIGKDGYLDLNKLFKTSGTEIDYNAVRQAVTNEMNKYQSMETKLNEQLKAHEESLKTQTKDGYIEIELKKKEMEERKKSIESQARKREIDLLRIESETALKIRMDKMTEEERKGLLSYKEFTDKAIIEKEQEQRKVYEQSQSQIQSILGEDLSKYTTMHQEGVFKGTYFLEDIDLNLLDETQKEGVRNIIEGMRNNVADIEAKFFDTVEEQARNNTYIQNILNRVKSENKLDIEANALLMESLNNDIETYNLIFSKALEYYNEELSKTPFDVLTNEEKDNIKNLHDNLQKTRKELYEKQLKQLELELGDSLRVLVERGFDVNSTEYKNLVSDYQNKRQSIDTSYLNDARSINDNAKMKNNKPSRQLEQWQNDLSSYMNGIQPIIDNSMTLINSLFDYYSQVLSNQLDSINKAISSTESQIQDSMNNIDRMSADLEGKESGRRDALLRGIEEERERQEELTQYKLKLQEDAAKKEKELAKQKQRQSLLQAIISTALGVTTALGSSVPPLNFINAGLVGAAGGVQIATIASQKFAKGGYTGDGYGNKVDETGYRVAGVVHEGEYVIPKHIVNSNMDMVNNIEQMRVGGSTMKDNSIGIERELISLRRDLVAIMKKPIYTNAVESNRVSTGRNNKMVSL